MSRARGVPLPVAPRGRGVGAVAKGVPGTGAAGAARDAALAGQGWRRRFVGGPPRLDEMVALYRELGHEVRLEALDAAELAEGCRGCGPALSVFRVVYTRMPA